jgi:hypothetical protein
MDERKEYSLTIRTTGISSHGFNHIQVPFNPEYFGATTKGYEIALERMDELWADPLNRRIQLLLVSATETLLIEDWNKDDTCFISSDEEE